MTIVLPHPVLSDTAREPLWQPREPTSFRSWIRRRTQIGETGLLAIIALAGYIAVGFWMRYNLFFSIDDALSRTADAVYVVLGRDPHAAAIGFFWPPLPQLIQIPLVVAMAPFGQTEMAGPVSSAVCMALTIPVLGCIGTRLGLGRWTRLAICVAFALNPVMIYYAANGMSEACSILFIAIAMLGFLTFIDTRSTPDLIVLGLGLTGAMLTRLEAPFLTIVIVTVAAFERRNPKRSLWTAFLIALPPFSALAAWMVIQWVLLGSPTFFLHQNVPKAPAHPVWLPDTQAHPLLAIPWALHWALVLAPIFLVLVGFLIIKPPQGAWRGTIGILCATATFLAIQAYQIVTNTGFGDPRYFVTTVLFGTIGAAWLASVGRITLRVPGAATACSIGVICLLLLGWFTGSRELTNGRLTFIEGECVFFEYGVAKVLPFVATDYPSGSADHCTKLVHDPLQPWRDLDATLDRMLTPRDRVLADNSVNFDADLFTDHANQFIVRNDRDWQKIAANPTGFATYIITQLPVGDTGGINEVANATAGDVGLNTVRQDPSAWKLVVSLPGAATAGGTTTIQLYKYVGSDLNGTPG